MPAYNEEGAIAAALDDVQRHVLDHVPGADLVVVNDGSRDGTGRLLDDIAAKDPRIHVIHQKNRGHGGALMAGLAASHGACVLLIDSDRQIPLDGFPAAWAYMQDRHDGVFGVRRRRCDPMLRRYLSEVIRKVVELLFGVKIRDANVPYKLLRREIWQEASACIPEGTVAPSLFLAIFARKRGFDIVEVDVVHRERDTGEGSIRRFKLLKFCATGLSQMWALRRCLHG